jgi:hypothetical protein
MTLPHICHYTHRFSAFHLDETPSLSHLAEAGPFFCESCPFRRNAGKLAQSEFWWPLLEGENWCLMQQRYCRNSAVAVIVSEQQLEGVRKRWVFPEGKNKLEEGETPSWNFALSDSPLMSSHILWCSKRIAVEQLGFRPTHPNHVLTHPNHPSLQSIGCSLSW